MTKTRTILICALAILAVPALAPLGAANHGPACSTGSEYYCYFTCDLGDIIRVTAVHNNLGYARGYASCGGGDALRCAGLYQCVAERSVIDYGSTYGYCYNELYYQDAVVYCESYDEGSEPFWPVTPNV